MKKRLQRDEEYQYLTGCSMCLWGLEVFTAFQGKDISNDEDVSTNFGIGKLPHALLAISPGCKTIGNNILSGD